MLDGCQPGTLSPLLVVSTLLSDASVVPPRIRRRRGLCVRFFEWRRRPPVPHVPCSPIYLFTRKDSNAARKVVVILIPTNQRPNGRVRECEQSCQIRTVEQSQDLRDPFLTLCPVCEHMNNGSIHHPNIIDNKYILRQSCCSKDCVAADTLIYDQIQLFLVTTLFINAYRNKLTRGSLGQQQPARQAVQLRNPMPFRYRLPLPHEGLPWIQAAHTWVH